MSRERKARPAMTNWSFIFLPPVHSNAGSALAASFQPSAFSGQRAGFFQVGVEPLNGVAVALFDDAPLEFHGVGQAAIVEGKVLVKQGDRKSTRLNSSHVAIS